MLDVVFPNRLRVSMWVVFRARLGSTGMGSIRLKRGLKVSRGDR